MADTPKELLLHPGAVTELQDSVAFYREQGGDPLAERFKTAVRESFETIQTRPQWYPWLDPEQTARKIRLIKFPFSIIYIERLTAVWIVAIAHGSRKPGYWFRRLGQR
jgi:toxin ParE1/3/4